MNSSISVNNSGSNFLKLKNVSNVQQMLKCGLSKDAFQKSNISFKGISEILDDDIKIQAEREGLLIGLLDSSAKTASIQKMATNSMNYAKQAGLFRLFMSELQQNQAINKDWSYIINLLDESNITTFRQLESFAQSYRKDKNAAKVFEYQNIEALKIYRELDDKSDMRNFPELLLNIYYINEESEEDKKIDYNLILSFLKQVDVKNQEEFDEKFSYLKPEFNNFEKTEDKIKAVISVLRDYSSKMYLLQEITKANPKLSCKPEKIYAQINDIVDYFYKINNGESLDGINDILELALMQGKIKKTSLDKVSPYFNGFEQTIDKIQFLKLLSSCGVDIHEFNNLTTNSIISDNNILENIENKKYFTTRIAQLDGENEESAKKIYSNFKDLINALCPSATEANANLKFLVSVIKENKISNSAVMLNFYQKMTGIRQKSLTADEFREFIELLNYPVDNIQEKTKNKKVAPIEFYKQEKARFDKVKDEIEIGKKSGSLVFASQSALDIYKTYKDVILKSDNKSQTVSEIAMFGIENSDEYQGKMQEVEKFRKFFQNDEDLSNFLEINSIKFDGSKTEEKFIENCMEIFNSILDSNDKKKEEKLKYFAQSGFLINSEDKLNELLEKTKEPKKRNDVFSTIAERKISSVGELEKFINKFKLPNSNGEEIFEYLKKLPQNCDFKQTTDTLNMLCALIERKFLPLQIDENNIGLINPNSYVECANNDNKMTLQLFYALYKPRKNCNFLRTMSSAPKTCKEKYPSYKIALELANNIEKSDESYQNIVKLLQIDKKSLGLNERCAPRMYAGVIEKMFPRELINFINSDNLFEYVAYDDTVPNVSLHARLRLLDRFILPEIGLVSDLDKNEVQEKVKKIYETIFKSQPYEINGFPGSKRIEAYFDDGNQKFKVIFSPSGEVITITPPKQSHWV